MFLVSCSLERSEPTASIPKDSVIADLHKSTSSYVSSDSACTVVANKSGGFDMYCGGYFVGNLYDALDSSSSKNDGACVIEEIAKSDGYDVYCGGIKQGELHNGKDGVSCNASQDNVTEEISVSCGGELIGILHNGKDGKDGDKGEKGERGESCELRDNAKGDGYDVYCGDTKQGELHNGKTGATGKQGATGESCSAESSNNGDVKITCGKNTVTLQKGENGTDGVGCSLNDFGIGVEITCGENSTYISKDPTKPNFCEGENRVRNPYDEKTQICDTRDGQIYNIVTIGTQTWMAQNLNYEVDDSYCYDNLPENCTKYGRLYEWEAAVNACPSGWYLPTKEEWMKLLTKASGDLGDAGVGLKSTSGGWLEFDDENNFYYDANGVDKYGFSVLPAGFGVVNSNDILFKEELFRTRFWYNNTNFSNEAYCIELSFAPYAENCTSDQNDVLAVRCIKN